jgi:hypothetical protein
LQQKGDIYVCVMIFLRSGLRFTVCMGMGGRSDHYGYGDGGIGVFNKINGLGICVLAFFLNLV